MRYGSICSGIEAATVAWDPLGWKPVFFSEIEPFPRAVLQHHYPTVPLHGDFTTIEKGTYGKIDLLVAGTPCQDFSVAGLRQGLAGDRGKLTIEYTKLLGRLRPRWFVWENVPGVLSIDGGRAFGIFLGEMAKLGYGFAYRVLDAQFFGVPQRRRRVFVVGHIGNWVYPAQVLFDAESLSGNITPRNKEGAVIAALTANGVGAGGGPDDNAAQAGHLIAPTLQAHASKMWAESPMTVAFTHKDNGRDASEISPTLRSLSGYGANDGSQLSIAYQCHGNNVGPMGTLKGTNINTGVPFTEVRRLTPVECERLQGFPDGYTLVPFRCNNKPAADGPRYKALGNSMAVPCMKWIGERIEQVESNHKRPKKAF